MQAESWIQNDFIEPFHLTQVGYVTHTVFNTKFAMKNDGGGGGGS